MRSLRILVGGAIVICASGTLLAKPAMKGVRTVTQPDGSQIEVRVVGDEYLHFTTLTDGTLLHRDSNGFYSLGAIADDGAIVSAGVAASDKVRAKTSGVKLTGAVIADIREKRQNSGWKKQKRGVAQTGMGLYSDKYPVVGSPKGLIILVEYTDVKFNTSYDAKGYFNEMINGENFTQYGGTGSALKYFSDQSGGKFTPVFDVYGPVTLPKNRKYYGGNDRYGEDQHPEEMLTDAVDILDATVDFSLYDTNGDGYVDNVYIIYAGQGEADYGSEDCVWPHSWDLSDAGVTKTADGVYIDRYACSNEWSDKTPDGIGTFVHEFSHVMGLPDLYHTTDPNAEYTPDAYSVMDYGPYNNDSRTPPNYGAYEKNAMGWYEPIMLTEPMSVTLHSIDSGEFGLAPTDKTTEFYLFENRQQEGWDTYIPNHGMLIWHIDYKETVFLENTVNNDKSHQYVDLVEANNKPGWDYLEEYTFPGTTGKTSFTADTKPAFKSWAGKSIDYPITDIAETDGVVTFDVAGGANGLSTPEPKVVGYSEEDGYFIVSWEDIEGATDYFISIYSGTSDLSGEITCGFDNSRLPAGWSASATDWYSTTSNYGESAPSYKFGKDGQTLTSEETEGDINKIEFWAKGQSSDGTTLTIEGNVNGAWMHIATYTPIKNKTEIATIDTGIPSGVRQIRFTMNKATGNIAIDDIVLTYGGGAQLLDNYDNVSTGGKTSFLADILPAGVKEYYFTVTATDGEKTRTSAPVYVLLDGELTTDGIGIISTEEGSEAEYYSLQGIRISNPQRGSVVIEKKGNSIRKVIR